MGSFSAGPRFITVIGYDHLFLVAQAFSYPGGFVAERLSADRMAETLDKLEEDTLGGTATLCGQRRSRSLFRRSDHPRARTAEASFSVGIDQVVGGFCTESVG